MTQRSFPSEFRWGAATSAYQIEGATSADGRGESIWDLYARRPGSIAGNQRADVSADHYHRSGEDIAWLGRLGANAYRLSVAWPRVLPEGTGRVEERGLDFYERLVDGLLGVGVEPWITLYHWDLPASLGDRGGWLNRDVVSWFGDYAELVVRRLSDRVTRWITCNEPQVFIGEGYFWGRHAPGSRLPWKEVLMASHHALLAHGRAVGAIRASAARSPSIGYAPAGAVRLPATNTTPDVGAAYADTCAVSERGVWNLAWWLDPVVFGRYPSDGLELFGADAPVASAADLAEISRPIDFLGLNLYWGPRVSVLRRGAQAEWEYPAGHPQTAFGWPIVPDILYWGPRFVAERWKLPLVVAENGMSSHDAVAVDGRVHDGARVDFITRHLVMLQATLAAGVDVRGYFHWSLLDNFEWAEGFRQRFGLLYVDYPTGNRTPKDSFYHYRDIIASRGTCLPTEAPGIAEPSGWLEAAGL
jgi:beta-glucosidase